MKIQHYAIIFIIIILPYSIICKSRIDNKIDILNNETRINNSLDVATMDAVDTLIDLNDEYYALYDGEMLDVTPTIAKEGIKTFFQSLSVNNNLPFVSGDTFAESYFASYIPAIIVIAYDGFYIYSMEDNSTTGTFGYVLSPKIPYTLQSGNYYINFTLGNYIKLFGPNGVLYEGEIKKDYIDYASGEYTEIYDALVDAYYTPSAADMLSYVSELTDDMSLILYALNKAWYVLPSFLTTESGSGAVSMLNDYEVDRDHSQVSEFHRIRRETIINIIVDTLNEKINRHNRYADIMGVTYNFYLPQIDNADWINAVDDISIMAFVQGIPTGYDTYYNSYALGSSRIIRTDYIYGTSGDTVSFPDVLKGLYHKKDCPYLVGQIDDDGYPIGVENSEGQLVNSLIDNLFLNKIEAALAGYYPCMRCKP